MPGIIAERVANLFDPDHDGYFTEQDFIEIACKLLSKKFEDNIRLVFEIYDFDNDQIISREDIRTVLSYVPLSEILSNKKLNGRKEGIFTRSGGG